MASWSVSFISFASIHIDEIYTAMVTHSCKTTTWFVFFQEEDRSSSILNLEFIGIAYLPYVGKL